MRTSEVNHREMSDMQQASTDYATLYATTNGRDEGAVRPDRLLKLDEVKQRVGLGKSMIYRLIHEGQFPAPYKILAFASRWSDHEIAAWIDNVKDGFEGKRRKA